MRTITVNPPRSVHVQTLDLSVKPRQAFVLARQTTSRFFRNDEKALATAQQMAEGSARALSAFKPMDAKAKSEAVQLLRDATLNAARKNPIPDTAISGTLAFGGILLAAGAVMAFLPALPVAATAVVIGTASAIFIAGLAGRQNYASNLASKIGQSLYSVAGKILDK
ncbi:MAG: hypothetical protein KGH63_01160 [Candidatus Micrarchaeota archaeon]|nr:hypothetical protein [Candidatus Micrarchaeota archaeon]